MFYLKSVITRCYDFYFAYFTAEYRLLSNPKKACIFPILEIFFPNLRILLGFFHKFKRHRQFPQKGYEVTMLYQMEQIYTVVMLNYYKSLINSEIPYLQYYVVMLY